MSKGVLSMKRCWLSRSRLILVSIALTTVYLWTKFASTPIGLPLSSRSKDSSNLALILSPSTNSSFMSHVSNLTAHGGATKKSLITFDTIPLPVNESETYDNGNLYPCTQPQGPGPNEVEDLMCMPRPKFLPSMKNPCFEQEDAQKIVSVICLPHYFLIGTDKCGTTDFSHRLNLHPSVLPNDGMAGKETYYWCWSRFGIMMKFDIEKNRMVHYINNFKTATEEIVKATLDGVAEQPVVGDGTPMDFWDFRGWSRDPQNKGQKEPRVMTPHVIRHLFPHPKFILLMRNPVERLFSDYIFLKYGNTSAQFDNDVPLALEMMNSCLKVNSTKQCFFSYDMYHRLPMRPHVSCYSVFLREWLAVFHRRHFYIVRTEDYHKNPEATLQDAFSFLGIARLPEATMSKILEREKIHETVKKKTAGTMSAVTRALLEEFYAPCNRDLASLLGDDRFLW